MRHRVDTSLREHGRQARQRWSAVLAGSIADRPPVAWWQHFPGKDLEAATLAGVMLDYQRRFRADVVKMMPCGLFSVMDYGGELHFADADHPPVLARPLVTEPQGWERVRAGTPVQRDEQIEAVRRVRDTLGSEQPIVATVFSPLTTLCKMAPPDVFQRSLVEDAQGFRRLLEEVTASTVSFAQAVIEAGANGIFLATQCSTSDVCSRDAYTEFGVPGDRTVIDALPDAAAAESILHIHGENIYFELADMYPFPVVNWHDQRTEPSLAQAAQRTTKVLAGGLDREWLKSATLPEVTRWLTDTRSQMPRPFVVAPSCVLRPETSSDLLDGLRSWSDGPWLQMHTRTAG